MVLLHGTLMVSVPPNLLDLFAPFVSVPTGVHQIVRPVGCVNKKGLEVLGFWPQLQRPRNLSFQDFVDRVHVVEVGPFCEQQLAPASKEPLPLVYWPHFQY